MTNAFIYCRSAVADVDAVASQEAACRAYAETHGLSVVGVHSDDGVSGMDMSRVGLDAVLDSLTSGRVVLVDNPARLSRNPDTYARIAERIAAKGARIVAVSEKDVVEA